MEHKKYEYQIIPKYYGLSVDQEQEFLNEQGQDGWEVCIRTEIEIKQTVEFIFKRVVL